MEEVTVEEAFKLCEEMVAFPVELPPATTVLRPAEGTTAAGMVVREAPEVTVALTMGTGMRVESAEDVAIGETSTLDSTAEETEATTLDAMTLETDSTADDATTAGAVSVVGAYTMIR